MEDEKITLDRESFRALASDTRIFILKSLGRRRKMLTELSKELGMSPSTVKEHMDSLSKAGLAVMIDDGHKWKYYELTAKGKNVLNPGQTKVWIMLSISIVGMLVASQGIIFTMFPQQDMMAFSAMKAADDTALRAPAPTGGAGAPETAAPLLSEAADGAATDAGENALELPQLPYLHIAALAAFGVIAAFCAVSLARNGKKGKKGRI